MAKPLFITAFVLCTLSVGVNSILFPRVFAYCLLPPSSHLFHRSKTWLSIKSVHCIFDQLILGCYHKKDYFNEKPTCFSLFCVACVLLAPAPQLSPTVTLGAFSARDALARSFCTPAAACVASAVLEDESRARGREEPLSLSGLLISKQWSCCVAPYEHASFSIYWKERLLQFFIYFVF